MARIDEEDFARLSVRHVHRHPVAVDVDADDPASGRNRCGVLPMRQRRRARIGEPVGDHAEHRDETQHQEDPEHDDDDAQRPHVGGLLLRTRRR